MKKLMIAASVAAVGLAAMADVYNVKFTATTPAVASKKVSGTDTAYLKKGTVTVNGVCSIKDGVVGNYYFWTGTGKTLAPIQNAVFEFSNVTNLDANVNGKNIALNVALYVGNPDDELDSYFVSGGVGTAEAVGGVSYKSANGSFGGMWASLPAYGSWTISKNSAANKLGDDDKGMAEYIAKQGSKAGVTVTSWNDNSEFAEKIAQAADLIEQSELVQRQIEQIQELLGVKETLEGTVAELQGQIDENNRTIAENEKQIKDLDEQLNGYDVEDPETGDVSHVDGVKDELAAKKAELEEANKDLQLANEELEFKKAQIEDLDKQLNGYDVEDPETGDVTHVDGVKDELAKAKEDLADLDKQLNGYDVEDPETGDVTHIDGVKDEKANLETKKAELEKKVAELDEKAANLQAELDAASTTIESVADAIKILNNGDYTGLTQTIKDYLEEQIQGQKDLLATATQERDDLLALIEEYEHSLTEEYEEELATAYEEAKAAYEDAEAVLKEADDALNKLNLEKEYLDYVLNHEKDQWATRRDSLLDEVKTYFDNLVQAQNDEKTDAEADYAIVAGDYYPTGIANLITELETITVPDAQLAVDGATTDYDNALADVDAAQKDYDRYTIVNPDGTTAPNYAHYFADFVIADTPENRADFKDNVWPGYVDGLAICKDDLEIAMDALEDAQADLREAKADLKKAKDNQKALEDADAISADALAEELEKQLTEAKEERDARIAAADAEIASLEERRAAHKAEVNRLYKMVYNDLTQAQIQARYDELTATDGLIKQAEDAWNAAYDDDADKWTAMLDAETAYHFPDNARAALGERFAIAPLDVELGTWNPWKDSRFYWGDGYESLYSEANEEKLELIEKYLALRNELITICPENVKAAQDLLDLLNAAVTE